MPYATVDDVRSAGLTDEVAYPDDDVLAALQLASDAIDRATKQWFEPRQLTILFDGNGSDTIHLGIPIISISALYLNDDTTPLDTKLFRVYSSRTYPDDRRNPRVKLTPASNAMSFFQALPLTSGLARFVNGRQNQKLVGLFGFIEPDGSTPLLVKRANLKVALRKLGALVQGGGPSPPPLPPAVAALISEQTDGHSYTTAQAKLVNRRPGLAGLFDGDPEIADIVKLYRAPIGLAVSSSNAGVIAT